MTRIVAIWPWLVFLLAIGFLTPSLVNLAAEIAGGRSVGRAFQDIISRQFAEGHNLFWLALITLIPFLLLGSILLVTPVSYSSARVACIAIGGLLGILILLLPVHWQVWAPLFSSDKNSASTSVIGLLVVPFACIVPMLVGSLIGRLVSRTW